MVINLTMTKIHEPRWCLRRVHAHSFVPSTSRPSFRINSHRCRLPGAIGCNCTQRDGFSECRAPRRTSPNNKFNTLFKLKTHKCVFGPRTPLRELTALRQTHWWVWASPFAAGKRIERRGKEQREAKNGFAIRKKMKSRHLSSRLVCALCCLR